MQPVQIDRQAAVAVVTASGELDAFLAPQLEAAFAEVGGDERVLVDLGRVSFLDSTALGTIVRAARASEERGAELRVLLPRGSARRIFEITTLDSMLPVAPSREVALAELG